MSERGRIALIFVVIGGLVLGGAFYFFKVWRPKQVRGAAADQVEIWENRWAMTRDCLFGAKPSSPRPGEAIAIRELSPDPWEGKNCTPLIANLIRGEMADSGVQEIEQAWQELDKKVNRVAVAFASHVDPRGDTPTNRKRDPLPGALDELATAHAALREITGMEPAPSAPGTPLAPAQIVPLQYGGEPVKTLDSWSMPSSNSVIAFGKSGAREFQLRLVPNAAPGVSQIQTGVLVGMSDPSWGASGRASSETGADLIVGAVDAKAGTIVPDQTVSLPALPTLFAVAGGPADGLVVAGDGTSLRLARRTQGKALADKPIALQQLAFAVEPTTGRVLIAWNAPDGALRGQIARGAAPAKVHELGGTFARSACLTQTRGWVGGAGKFVAFDDASGLASHELPDHELLGCTADAALLHKLGAAHYVVCTTECRIAQLEGMKPSSVGTLAGERVVGVAASGNVIGIWREKSPPAYFATPAPLRPRLAISDGVVVDVLSETDDGLVIARIKL